MTLSEIARWMLEHPSSIREIMTLVAEYRRHPEKFPRELIYLAGGWPQDPPPPILREKLKEVVESDDLWRYAASYSPTSGYPEVIDAVIEYEKGVFGRPVAPEEVIFGLGSSEQIGAVFIALLDPDDEVIVTAPGYLNYVRQLMLECKGKVRVKYWRVVHDAKFEPREEDLKELASPRTKLIVICSPGNPDGQVWSDEQLKFVHDIAEDCGAYVLIDVAYRAFIFSRTPRPRYLSRERWEREIWVCTLSKELRIPGWRASYMLLPRDLRRAIDTIEQARTLAPSSLVQATLVRLFTDKKALSELRSFYERGALKYESVARLVVERLRAIEGIRVLEPMGGFYVFFDVSRIDRDSRRVCQELLTKYQVALTPGVDFNGFEGWIRLSFAPVVETPEKLAEALSRIESYFSEKRGAT